MPDPSNSESDIKYDFCIHRDRYRIKSAKFFNYLTTECQGFAISRDEKYTAHYLLVILFTNWGSQRLISKCNVLINKQIREVFNIKHWRMPLFHFRFYIFPLLEVPPNYNPRRCPIWTRYQRAEPCEESKEEAKLVGRLQQGHCKCSKFECIRYFSCYGYFTFYLNDEITSGSAAPNSHRLVPRY